MHLRICSESDMACLACLRLAVALSSGIRSGSCSAGPPLPDSASCPSAPALKLCTDRREGHVVRGDALLAADLHQASRFAGPVLDHERAPRRDLVEPDRAEAAARDRPARIAPLARLNARHTQQGNILSLGAREAYTVARQGERKRTRIELMADLTLSSVLPRLAWLKYCVPNSKGVGTEA